MISAFKNPNHTQGGNQMKRVKRSRLLAILLTVAMTFSVCGVTAFAETNYGILSKKEPRI